MMVKVKLLIVDDHKMFREGRESLLKDYADFEVVAMAKDGREALKLCAKHVPDIVLMDISLPGLNGVEATRQIVWRFPDIRVIGLSMHADRRFVTGMLKAGAVGYLLKDCAFEELTRAFQTVMSGKIYLSGDLSDLLIKDYLKNLKEEDSPLEKLATGSGRCCNC